MFGEGDIARKDLFRNFLNPIRSTNEVLGKKKEHFFPLQAEFSIMYMHRVGMSRIQARTVGAGDRPAQTNDD